MKRLLILSFSLIFSFWVSAQKKGKEYLLVDSVIYDSLSPNDKFVLDSLLPLYHRAKDDTTRLSILAIIPELVNGEEIWPRYNHLLFHLLVIRLKDSVSMDPKELKSYKKSLGLAYQNLGYEEQFMKANTQKANEYYLEAARLQHASGDKKGEATSISNIGLIYNNKGDIASALDYFYRALKMQEELGDKSGMGYSLNNISAAYRAQDDTVKAMEYMKKSIKCREEAGDRRGYAISMANLSSTYLRMGKAKEALHTIRKTLPIWEQLGEKQGIGFAYQNIGAIFLSMANQKKNAVDAGADSLYENAMTNLKKGLKYYEETNYDEGISIIEANIGNCYLFQNNLQLAEKFGKLGYEKGRSIGYIEAQRNGSRLLYDVYRRQNKFKEALQMHEIYIQLRDSMFNQETQKSAFKQQTKYEYEKKQVLQDAEHQKELAVAEEGKKRQLIISFGIGFGLLLVILFSTIIFNRLRVTRKQKAEIEHQKKIVEIKNKHITDSINYAKRIQDSILPSKEQLSTCFSEYFILFQPKEIVSGDFYWISNPGEKIILAIADCTGHGVPGAFMSMIGNTLLNEIVNEKGIYQPGEILNQLNEGIVAALHQDSRTMDDGMDISVCLFDKNKITFAGANHSLYVVSNDSLEEIKGDIYSIGSAFGKKEFSFSQKEVPVMKGSTLYFSTDGLPDQLGGASGKKFLSKNLQKLLLSVSKMDIKAQEDKIKAAFNEWRGNHAQLDDILLAGIKI